LQKSAELGVVVMENQLVLVEPNERVMSAHRVLLFKVNIALPVPPKAYVGFVAERDDVIDDLGVIRASP
jgi:hypothetical protein